MKNDDAALQQVLQSNSENQRSKPQLPTGKQTESY
jgi:hypothetical protein